MNLVFEPSLVLTDFEKAAMNAVSTVLPYPLLVCTAAVSIWDRVGGDESRRWASLKTTK